MTHTNRVGPRDGDVVRWTYVETKKTVLCKICGSLVEEHHRATLSAPILDSLIDYYSDVDIDPSIPYVVHERCAEGRSSLQDMELDPGLCQYVTTRGRQCRNDPERDSHYCHVKKHNESNDPLRSNYPLTDFM